MAGKWAKKPQSAPRDIYQEVTDTIVAALELMQQDPKALAPWRKPWKGGAARGSGFPRNGATGREYNGLNVILLWATANARGYSSDCWYTFKQATEKGGKVRKGEKATLVTFWKQLRIREKDETTGETQNKRIPLLRYFYVFNADQIDGLPTPPPPAPRPILERLEEVEAFVAATGARWREVEQNRAYYAPGADEIVMPTLPQFESKEAFYSTLLHELTHWSGHSSRLNRDFSGRFGSEAYAREELVAEIGAAFLCARLDIEGSLQHPQYIANWLEVLKNDKKAIFGAASHARQATEFLTGTAPTTDEEEAEEEESTAEEPAAAPEPEPVPVGAGAGQGSLF